LVDVTRIQLCGTLTVQIDGVRIEHLLPGRQGRLLLAYLVLNRTRACSRDELLDAMWPVAPPSEADGALRALLSKLRRVLGDGALERTHNCSPDPRRNRLPPEESDATTDRA
jgi:DNA-binding SARP family transcriptional activator